MAQSSDSSPSNTIGSSAEYQTLSRLRVRQARLVVTIPALMVSYTLLLMVLIHFNLERIIDVIPQNQPAVYEQAVELSQLVLYLGIAGAIASGGVGMLLAWQIVRPLRTLITQMEQVASGDLPANVATGQFAEIGALSTSFNSMVQQLQVIFNERDRQMREAAAGSILTLNSAGEVISTDVASSRLLGIKTERLFNRTLADSLREEISTKNAVFLKALDHCLADARRGRVGISTAPYHHPDHKTPLSYSIEVTPMESGPGGGGNFLLDLRDMSGMSEFQEQIQRADRLAALGTLATGIAHEIRNPLASIRGMTQLLAEDLKNGHGIENGAANPASLSYLDRSLSEIERLERLVASIMDFTNSSEGPVKSVDINAVLQDVVEVCRHRMDPGTTTVEIEWLLDREMPDVPLEEARIRQAFINIVNNAFDALEGQREGKLRIQTRYQPESSSRPIIVSISNSGPPIDPDQRARIFEPFFTTKAEGTGLGLPITYQIVISNGGAMDLYCQDNMVEFRMRFAREGRMASSRTLSSSGGVPRSAV